MVTAIVATPFMVLTDWRRGEALGPLPQ